MVEETIVFLEAFKMWPVLAWRLGNGVGHGRAVRLYFDAEGEN